MPCLEMTTHAVHFFSLTASVRHPAMELYSNKHHSCCWHVLTAESVLRLKSRHDPKSLDCLCKCAFNAEDNIWRTLWKEHKNYANWLRWLKLCGQIVHRLKFEWTKCEEIWWTYVGLMKMFMGFCYFLGHPVHINFISKLIKAASIHPSQKFHLFGVLCGKCEMFNIWSTLLLC